MHYCARYSGEDSFKTAKTIFEKSGNDVNFLKAHSNGMSVAMNCCRANGNHLIFEMVMDKCHKGGQDYDNSEKLFFMNAACQKNNTKTVGVLLKMGLQLNQIQRDILRQHREQINNNSLQPTSAVTLKPKDKNLSLGADNGAVANQVFPKNFELQKIRRKS